jgi:hypothetical protein
MPKDFSLTGQDLKTEPVPGTTGPGETKNRYKETAKQAKSKKRAKTAIASGFFIAAGIASVIVANNVMDATEDKTNIKPGQEYELSGFTPIHPINKDEIGIPRQFTEDKNGKTVLTKEAQRDRLIGTAVVSQDKEGDYTVQYAKKGVVTRISTDHEDGSKSVSVKFPKGNGFSFEVEGGQIVSSQNMGPIGEAIITDASYINKAVASLEKLDNDVDLEDPTAADEASSECRRQLSHFTERMCKIGGEDFKNIVAEGVDMQFHHYGDESMGPGTPDTGLAVFDVNITLPDEQVVAKVGDQEVVVGTNSFSMEFRHDMPDHPGIKQMTIKNSFTDDSGQTDTNTILVTGDQVTSATATGGIGIRYGKETKSELVNNAGKAIGTMRYSEGRADFSDKLQNLRDITTTFAEEKAKYLEHKKARETTNSQETAESPAIDNPDALAAAEAAEKKKGLYAPGEIIAETSGFNDVYDKAVAAIETGKNNAKETVENTQGAILAKQMQERTA